MDGSGGLVCLQQCVVYTLYSARQCHCTAPHSVRTVHSESETENALLTSSNACNSPITMPAICSCTQAARRHGREALDAQPSALWQENRAHEHSCLGGRRSLTNRTAVNGRNDTRRVMKNCITRPRAMHVSMNSMASCPALETGGTIQCAIAAHGGHRGDGKCAIK
jgi:hypothetical protein